MALLDWLYPTPCVVCGQPKRAKESPFCPICHAKWELARRECSVEAGGLPVANYQHDEGRADYYGSAVYLVKYDPDDETSPVRGLIMGLKYRADRPTVDFAARELAALMRQVLPPTSLEAMVTQIPRRNQTIRRYGYDHMKLVAIEMAALLGLPYRPLLERSGDAQVQKLLSAEERAENALHSTRLARKYERSLTGRTVILVDDLITTGASLYAAAELLI